LEPRPQVGMTYNRVIGYWGQGMKNIYVQPT
jgi:hypothetical protein